MRRAKKEIRDRFGFHHEEVKEEVSDKDKIISELRDKIKSFEELRIVNDKNSQMLANLIDGGIIDEEGNVIAPQNSEETSSNTRLFSKLNFTWHDCYSS